MNKYFLSEDIAAIAQQLGSVAHDFAGKTLLLSGGRGFRPKTPKPHSFICEINLG